MSIELRIVQNIKEDIVHLEDYKMLAPNGLSERTLNNFKYIISEAAFGGDVAYDQFCDNGGIEIAALLYCEVMECRKIIAELGRKVGEQHSNRDS
jgi:hypothetical protein